MNNYNQYNKGGAMSPYKKSVPKYFLGGMLNQFFGSVFGGGGGGSTTPPTTPPTTPQSVNYATAYPNSPPVTPSPYVPSTPYQMPNYQWQGTNQWGVPWQEVLSRAAGLGETPGPSELPPAAQPIPGEVEAPLGETPLNPNEIPPHEAPGGISNWWKDRQKLMDMAGQRGRRGAASVMDIRGPVKQGGSPGGAYEDLLIEEENPYLAGGSPYLYKNVMGFQQGGKLNRGNATVTGQEFKSFNKSMAQIGLGIINSFGGDRAKGRFVNGGKF